VLKLLTCHTTRLQIYLSSSPALKNDVDLLGEIW